MATGAALPASAAHGAPPTRKGSAASFARAWRTARAPLDLTRPRVMGILNVTPDSFWDGGRHAGVERALAHAESMLAEGAELIDVGGESTRPGAEPITAEAEIERVEPVVREVVRRFPDALVTVDTVKVDVARAALAAGAVAINDVAALRLSPDLARLAAETGAGLILMHSRGGVGEMASYEMAEYGADPVGEVVAELAAQRDVATRAGVAADAILLDPGLGFSKTTEHSVACLRELPRLAALGHGVLVGPSRKRFVGDLGGGVPAEDRLEGTLAACVYAWTRGARLFRVHDVAAARRALDVAAGLAPATGADA